MKLRFTITISALALAMAGSGLARTWTSADGKNTFEGEFVSATDSNVTVKRANGKVTFAIAKLSDDDQAFIQEQVAAAAEEAAAKAESEKLKEAAVPKAIMGKMVKLDGKSLKRADEMEVVPEYYFLAYSASW